MTGSIHIIEPTLEGEAGHCHSFIASLCRAAGPEPITVWCGRGAAIALPENVSIKRLFIRKLRRLQALWLYRKLLRTGERVLISTAGRTDLILLDLASCGGIPANTVYLYIHWFRPSRSKRVQLEKLARRHPELVILTPTASVCEEFLSAGFTRTRLVPYPITPREIHDSPAEDQGFRHLLFAGAARQDKGFSTVVDLVELLALKGAQIPVTLQTSAEHYDKLDESTRRDLVRLDVCRYPYLRRYAETLTQADYLGLFAGGICLQLYSRRDFADRISGVTLDALSAGCPVITMSGTWIARTVAEFDAGLVLDAPDPERVLSAVTTLLEQYPTYRHNALKAGRELQLRHNAGYLMHELTA